MRQLFRQFSFPGGIGSHVTPETPGSIHEGGELGYALAHAFGAVLRQPGPGRVLRRRRRRGGDRPAGRQLALEQVPRPVRDGAVLPILHLNGYKIANPTVLARIPTRSCARCFEGYGYQPLFVEATTRTRCTSRWRPRWTRCSTRSPRSSERRARRRHERPRWPMIVLRTPKGWTGPTEVDGLPVEGTWRSHQVPLAEVRDNPSHLAMLEEWMRSYRPEELFDDEGGPVRRSRARAARRPADEREPARQRRRAAARPALPDFRDYAVEVRPPGTPSAEATRVLGHVLRDVIAANPRNFRLFGPDETDLEPARRGLRGHRPQSWRRDRCRPTSIWRPTAG